MFVYEKITFKMWILDAPFHEKYEKANRQERNDPTLFIRYHYSLDIFTLRFDRKELKSEY